MDEKNIKVVHIPWSRKARRSIPTKEILANEKEWGHLPRELQRELTRRERRRNTRRV